MKPVIIKVLGQKELLINWDDETETKIELKKLRRLCPCATCATNREEQSESYIPLFSSDQIKVSRIFEVGSYAIGITWNDGHNTGIYEFPYLNYLAKDSNSF